MEARSCFMVTWELSCPGPSFLREDQTVPINQCHGLFLFMPFFYEAESGYVVQAGHKLQIFLLAQSPQDRNDPARLNPF